MHAWRNALPSIRRRRAPATILALGALLLGIEMPRDAAADLTAECPSHSWFGNSPSHSDSSDWSEDAQGAAHDDEGNWFFTANEGDQQPYRLSKYTSDWDEVDGERDQGHLDDINGIPAELAALGYNHYGDLDHYHGYLFVPFTGGDKAAIAAIRADDLSLVDFVELHDCCQSTVGWLAINAAERMGGVSPSRVALYTSLSHITELVQYTLDIDKLEDPSIAGDWLSDQTAQPLAELDGSPFTEPFQHMQGGTFSPWGDLYVVNGFTGISPEDARGGIHLFRRNNDGVWQLMQESVQDTPEIGDPIFGYEYHPFATIDSLAQEPEGIDWWNRSNDPSSPYPGQLHAILLDNDINDDAIWFKHYRVDYWCVTNDDTDGDGLTDGDEVDHYGTSPVHADTDGDGADDGDDPFPTDPTESSDTDDDGTGDNSDLDDDDDGVPDASDECPLEVPASGLDADGDGCTDTIAGLQAIVQSLAPSWNGKAGLLAKLDDAQTALDAGNIQLAESKLQAFINQVNGQRGKSLTDAEADLLIAYATNLIEMI